MLSALDLGHNLSYFGKLILIHISHFLITTDALLWKEHFPSPLPVGSLGWNKDPNICCLLLGASVCTKSEG
jgi:hypothetical protein